MDDGDGRDVSRFVHPSVWPSDSLLAECSVRFMRRSGPGGQNRNKVETAAILTHGPTGIVAEANETRSQGENRRVALFRLRLALALAVRTPVESSLVPSELWRTRVRSGRISINPDHEDFPALLAEALDFLERDQYEPRPAAEKLATTPSQLIGLLRSAPAAFAKVNAKRLERGLHRLK